MASGFMTGLATGFLDAKAENMKTDREAKVKLAATMAAESRASQRRLKDRLAASQQDYEQEIARNMESLQMSREEAAKFSLLPKKDRGDVVSRAHQRTQMQGDTNAVATNAAGPESDAFLKTVQNELKASETIDIFAETQEERALKLGFSWRWILELLRGVALEPCTKTMCTKVWRVGSNMTRERCSLQRKKLNYWQGRSTTALRAGSV